MKSKQLISNIIYLFKHTPKRLFVFSITKKIVFLIVVSYIALAALFYQYTQKVSFPNLLSHQEQQMDSISLFIKAEIDHMPKLNENRLNYIRRKMLENSHIYSLNISTLKINVGKILPIETNLYLHYYKNQALLAKKYKFEDGTFIIYYKADQYVKEINELLNTAYLTFILMFITLVLIAIFLKLTLLPFTQLASVMKNIDYKSHSDTYILPKIDSKDERDDLISSFQELNFKQQEYANRLNILNLSLEDRVKKKTIELQELNNSLELKILKEVSKNRQKDKILSEQSRFAALGEMIGNIAHQWRQPLSAISTAAGNAKMENMLGVATKESVDDTFNRIDEYTQYLSDTIDDFRNYFKQDKKKKAFYVHDIIKTAISISRGSLNDIRIIEDYSDFDTKLIGYPSELMQVIINILNNAKDILEEQHIAKKYIVLSTTKEQTHVIIKIYDNGGGISKKHISSIFDPYFTTKHKSQGTGIGLYMSKEMIVKHMKGSLTASNRTFDIDATEYVGACFTISIPYN